MSILDSSIAPYLILLAIFSVLVAFFRRSLLKLILFLIVELILFALFPQLLVKFASLVGSVHSLLG